MNHARVASFFLLALGACSTQPSGAPGVGPGPMPDDRAPAIGVLDDLGTHHRRVATRSPAAQRLFDQGLVLAYAFNHDAAIASFRAAAREDPDCAMAPWGIALASGPHINNPAMDEARSRTAWEALSRARDLAARASELERELIDALAARYAADPAADRRPLDEAYAQAMREVWHRHPQDGDVGTLFAEALLDLQPWDVWTPDGQPKGNTPEIVATLEQVLRVQPENPGANHLYIHTMEASPAPERALAAADRLRTLVPGAGHLVHMPAHIDLRLGRYADASLANVRAMAADRKHAGEVPGAGFYRVYMAHNPHFLAFSSMMEGRCEAALEAARTMVREVPQEFLENAGPLIDGYLPVVCHVLVRFGRWQEILDLPPFPAHLAFSNATLGYARGVALAALGRTTEAEQELARVQAAITSMDGRVIGINEARVVLGIAARMLAGEIALHRGQHDDAVRELRAAAAIEDGLRYMEPPDWMHPVRHALGAVLIEAGRAAEAEQVFREDLKRFPENGWSLKGLSRALHARGLAVEEREADARFAKAWSRADVRIGSSCYCVAGDR